ncbi:MAG: hypothetical protein RE471_08200 [Ferroplasma sp.]|uniref:hypothetical protein n=1 Tax=Ferroplasma sp. TaxID=2591003 RepID=UPI00281592A0|nr:hypothetical protein [Ferroplasma sp.]WMT50948.1 MAG: hypothetical protein RE471_08200 [Ferroplasma sp.]
MDEYKYLKIYSIIDVAFIIIFSLLYVFTLKDSFILFIVSFSLLFLMLIFVYYSAKKGTIHFVKENRQIVYNKIVYILDIIILTFSLFAVFEITDKKIIRILSIIIGVIFLSLISYNYNKKSITQKNKATKT